MEAIKKWLPRVPAIIFFIVAGFIVTKPLLFFQFDLWDLACTTLAIAISAKCSFLLVDWLLEKLGATASHHSRIGAYIGAYSIYLFAVYLGFVASSSLRSPDMLKPSIMSPALDRALEQFFGVEIGEIGEIFFGLVEMALHMFIVTTMICSAFAVFGFFLGRLIGSSKWFKKWCDGQATRINTLRIFNSDSTNKAKFGTYSKLLGLGIANAIAWVVAFIGFVGFFVSSIIPRYSATEFFGEVLFSLVLYIFPGIVITAVLLPINLYLFIKYKTDDTIELTYANIVSVTMILFFGLVWWVIVLLEGS